MSGQLDLERDGAQLCASALDHAQVGQLRDLAEPRLDGVAGARLGGDPRLSRLLGAAGPIGAFAARLLGVGARPVRAVMFDKTARANWSVAWHQDRTIAVQDRLDAPGFGPWSRKVGVVHVEPPISVLERMITVRAHLDACDGANAPLRIALGSHRFGRVPAREIAWRAARCEQHSCLAEAGDAWVYRTLILHASVRSARPTRRRVLQVDYAAFELPGGLQWLGLA